MSKSNRAAAIQADIQSIQIQLKALAMETEALNVETLSYLLGLAYEEARKAADGLQMGSDQVAVTLTLQ